MNTSTPEEASMAHADDLLTRLRSRQTRAHQALAGHDVGYSERELLQDLADSAYALWQDQLEHPPVVGVCGSRLHDSTSPRFGHRLYVCTKKPGHVQLGDRDHYDGVVDAPAGIWRDPEFDVPSVASDGDVASTDETVGGGSEYGTGGWFSNHYDGPRL
jgi:hypothetical protein